MCATRRWLSQVVTQQSPGHIVQVTKQRLTKVPPCNHMATFSVSTLIAIYSCWRRRLARAPDGASDPTLNTVHFQTATTLPPYRLRQ